PAFVCLRADALSDVAALTLLVLSAQFATRLVEKNETRSAFLAGLFGGLGYLFRPETVQFAALAGLVLLGRTVCGRSGERRRAFLLALLVMVPVALCCAPYLFLRGSLLT